MADAILEIFHTGQPELLATGAARSGLEASDTGQPLFPPVQDPSQKGALARLDRIGQHPCRYGLRNEDQWLVMMVHLTDYHLLRVR